jgi:hypothetical protein
MAARVEKEKELVRTRGDLLEMQEQLALITQFRLMAGGRGLLKGS